MTTITDIRYEAIMLIVNYSLGIYDPYQIDIVKYRAIQKVTGYTLDDLNACDIHSLEDDAAPLSLAQMALKEIYQDIPINMSVICLALSNNLNG